MGLLEAVGLLDGPTFDLIRQHERPLNLPVRLTPTFMAALQTTRADAQPCAAQRVWVHRVLVTGHLGGQVLALHEVVRCMPPAVVTVDVAPGRCAPRFDLGIAQCATWSCLVAV